MESISPATVAYRPVRDGLRLLALWKGGSAVFAPEGRQSFGRSDVTATAALSVPVATVSRRHGEFLTADGACRYRDLGSTNGTSLNGRRLETGEAVLLQEGDVLRVHGGRDPAHALDLLLICTGAEAAARPWSSLPLEDARELRVGRDEAIAPDSPAVSRRHASFFLAAGGWAVIDHGSTNGVLRNGRRITRPEYLEPMDLISVAGYLFLFTGDELRHQVDIKHKNEPTPEEEPVPAEEAAPVKEPAPEEAPVPVAAPAPAAQPQPERPKPSPRPRAAHTGGSVLSIDIEERSVWNRMKKKTLLKDVHLEIPSGSLVLILGGSGAGKTTFLNAVMGYEQAEGTILYRDTDIYEEYERMKYEIGYVPQKDLLRKNDTVWDTILNSAQMRLPTSLDDEELERRALDTLQLFGLEREKDSQVSKLSGGQCKRLSIAVEYIGNPSLFFLDEPDSGLDGTMSRALMEKLREIADMDKIVLVISHSPDRGFELFDRLIVLGKGSDDVGHLVFTGTPAEGCRFFGVEHLEDIVRRINRKDEGGEGRADEFIRRFAGERSEQ